MKGIAATRRVGSSAESDLLSVFAEEPELPPQAAKDRAITRARISARYFFIFFPPKNDC